MANYLRSLSLSLFKHRPVVVYQTFSIGTHSNSFSTLRKPTFSISLFYLNGIKKPMHVTSIRFCSEKPFIKKYPLEDKKGLWKRLAIILTLGAIATLYMLHLKQEKLILLEKERRKVIGKSAIGGKFELVDQDNKLRTSDEFLGQWLLIYFGFTHCPDICPDEMEKLAEVTRKINEDKDMPNVQPLFITVDPQRDTGPVVGKYVKEFSDKIIGLTGTVEQIAAVCKAYRVYFSAGPKDKDSDYIVDHSIIMYLVDPEGQFLDYFGRVKDADQIVDSVRFNVEKYKSAQKKGLFSNIFS